MTGTAQAVWLYSPYMKDRPCSPVTEFGELFQQLLANLWATFYDCSARGLAAPQIGVFEQVAVLEHETERLVLVNPKIIGNTGSSKEMEACLSIPPPQVCARVWRPESVRVRFQDENGVERDLCFGGVLGRIVQHEIDHLSGKFFVDLLGPLQRRLVLGKMRKFQSRNCEEDRDHGAA